MIVHLLDTPLHSLLSPPEGRQGGEGYLLEVLLELSAGRRAGRCCHEVQGTRGQGGVSMLSPVREGAKLPLDAASIAVYIVTVSEVGKPVDLDPAVLAYLRTHTLRDVRDTHYAVALEHAGWAVTRAAKRLGVTRRSVYLALERLRRDG